MHIILGDAIAAQLRERHTVLQLETLTIKGEPVTAYCVVMSESIALTDMPDLERLKRLHQALIDALNTERFDTVLQCIEHLKGRFGGELDSFYEIIANRIKEQAGDK